MKYLETDSESTVAETAYEGGKSVEALMKYVLELASSPNRDVDDDVMKQTVLNMLPAGTLAHKLNCIAAVVKVLDDLWDMLAPEESPLESFLKQLLGDDIQILRLDREGSNDSIS